jgi:hypothetical protein
MYSCVAVFLAYSSDMTEPTTVADCDKILAGAKVYLDVHRDHPDKTGEFLDGLRCQLGWSPSEVMALQLRVADILLDYGMSGPIIQDARAS